MGTPSRPRAGGRNWSRRRGTPTKERETEANRSTSPGSSHGVPRRAPVRRGVRAGGCAGAGRGPLCQGNMRALPLAVPLPGEAGPACGGSSRRTEGEHRGAAAGRGHRGVAQAVCHGRDRGDKLRAEARPRAWVLAEGAVGCGLVYLKALACNFKRMVHARLVEMDTAQPERYLLSQPREGPAP